MFFYYYYFGTLSALLLSNLFLKHFKASSSSHITVWRRCQPHTIHARVPTSHISQKIKFLSFFMLGDGRIAGFAPSHRLWTNSAKLGSSLWDQKSTCMWVYSCACDTHTHTHICTLAQEHAQTLSGWLTCSSWLEHSLILLLSQMDSVFLFLSGVTSGGAHTHTHTHCTSSCTFVYQGGKLLFGF